MKQQPYFTLNENNIYEFTKWNQYGISVFFSTKIQGHSANNYSENNLALHVGDNPDDVIQNRHDFALKINQPLENFVFSNQTHSTNIIEVCKNDCSRGIFTTDDAIDDCDGLYTFNNDVVINAFVADCTPIYLIAPSHQLICVIHAGWQGTVKSITYKAITTICQKHNIDPKSMQILIGPSIESTNFEVEKDVINLIKQMDYLDYSSCYNQINDIKYKVNVKRLNFLQAISAGIKKENIFVTDIDTYSNDKLFSYRQNNITGRMCASIYQKNN